MTSNIENLKIEAMKLSASFPKVKFTSKADFGYSSEYNMFYIEKEDGDLVLFNISDGFLNYLHTSTLKDYVDAKHMKALMNGKLFKELATYILVAKETSENSGKKKTSKHSVYTLAMVNSMAYALLVNYNPFTHLEVVEKILESSVIQNRVSGYYIKPELMEVKISSNMLVDHIPDFGFVVQNGMTGIVPLSLKGFVTLRSGKSYKFNLKTAKRKHLSLVGIVINEITDEIAEKDLKESVMILGRTAYDKVFEILQDEEYISIVSYIQTKITETTINVLDILNIISEVSGVQGFKVISEKSIEKIVKELCQ